MKKILVIVAGPTAVGKTNVAIQLAKHFKTEVISADSRQFYKELSIGTAKPSLKEMDGIKHHFIDSLSIEQSYSVADFEKEALAVLDAIYKKSSIAIVCGGTGLFIKALCEGLDDIPSADETIREALEKIYAEKGITELQKELEKVDPETYKNIDLQNKQRVMRALEVYRASGKPMSSFKTNTQRKRDFDVVQVVLDLPREELYERINLRVDNMIEQGLLKEAESVYNYKHLNALQTVGYTELFDFFENKIDLTQAIDKIKQHTRNLAKRQLTWFRRDDSAQWFSPKDTEGIIEYIKSRI